MFSAPDWSSILTFEMPIAEIFLRGTLTYLGLFLLLRIILKRQAGAMTTADLLVVVLIADAAQNGMAGDYQTVPDGLLLVATILFWNYMLDALGYYIPFIGRFVHPSPLPLIENGKVNHRNRRQEFLTMEELKSQLREQGIDKIELVKNAFLEGDGRISVVAKKQKTSVNNERKQAI
jgi:uncharacterized membrane protein YcaP (DUF421 family)